MNLEISNADRIARADGTLMYYSFEKGESSEGYDKRTTIVDLLADLMHLCGKNGHDWLAVTQTALMHYRAESEEES